MELWAALVAVLGTLAASLGTFVLQDRAQRRRDREANHGQAADALRRACTAFATAADDVRRLQVERYMPSGGGSVSSGTAAPRGARVEQALADLFRLRHEVELMTGAEGLLDAVAELVDHTARLYEARDTEAVQRAVPEAAEAYRTFLAEARRVLVT